MHEKVGGVCLSTPSIIDEADRNRLSYDRLYAMGKSHTP